jgi:hypothetical protein
VTVFTHNRHPKDIMRSISHELVHHTQNCRGDLSNVAGEQGQGYAQKNDHLREMEREAYEQGNLCFRDWEDGIKSNIEPGTIYEKRSTNMGTVKDHFKRRDANLFERTMKKFGYMKEGDDWYSDEHETLADKKYADRGPSGVGPDEVKVNLGDVASVGKKGKYFFWRHTNGLKNSYTDEGKFFMSLRDAGLSMNDANRLTTQLQQMQEGFEAAEAGAGEEGSDAACKHTDDDSEDCKKHAEAGAKVDEGYDAGKQLWMQKWQEAAGNPQPPPQDFWDTAMYAYRQGKDPVEAAKDYMSHRAPDEDPMDDFNYPGSRHHYQEAHEGGEGVHDIFNMPEPEAVEPTGNPKEDALRQIVAQSQAAKVDGVMVDGYTASAIVQVLDAIRPDVKEKYLAAPIHVMAKLALSQVKERKIKEALKRAFKKNPALIEVAKKVDMKKLAERFRGSPEEKEMTSKMSNKEFSDYHTRDKHIVPDLKGDMGPIPGMEGPFQYADGSVLYYDPKAGKYYDRGKDMYLDNEEASRITMNESLNEGDFVGHHAEIDGKTYVDSNFLNSVRKIRDTFPHSLESMGFGEFYLNTPKGRIDFDRMRGQDFPGMVGRSHQLSSNPPELADELIDAMEQAGASETPLPSEGPPPGMEDSLREGEGDQFQKGDHVQDDRTNKAYVVVEPMAGGAVVEDEEGKIEKIRSQFLSKVEGAPQIMKEKEPALPQGEPTMQNEEIARKLKELLEGKKIKKDQVGKLAKMVAAKLLEKKYKRDDEETEDKDEKEDLEESGSACGGAPETIKLKVDRDGDEPGDLPGDGLEPVEEKTKKDLADRKPTDTPADRLKAQEGKSKQTHYRRDGKDESSTIDPEKDDKSSDESDDDKEKVNEFLSDKIKKNAKKINKKSTDSAETLKALDKDASDKKEDDDDEKEDLDEKTKKDVADRKPSDTPQDRLKPLEERGYGRGNEEPGSMFDPYENEEDEYGGGYGGEEDELAQYKDLLAALDSGGPVDGGEVPADVQAQMDAEFGSEEDEEEDPFGDPLKEWWDIRNARRTEKFMSWAIPKKK